MTFPNSEKGPFEGENDDWCHHVAQSFVAGVTNPQLLAPGCDAAHAAMAHAYGLVMCAVWDAAHRGGLDVGTMIMPDVLKKVRELLDALEAGSIGVSFPDKLRPNLTVLPGGKKEATSCLP